MSTDDKDRLKFDPATASMQREAEMEQRRNFELPDSIPSFSLGAFLVPPIWGAAHGQWATLLFYPLWVFADNVFRNAFFGHQVVYVVGAIVMLIAMTGVTIFYGATAQKPAYYRVRDKYTPEQYVKHERIWSVCMIVLGAAMIALATYYNLYLFDPATLQLQQGAR